jgi:hypothetical protein
LEIVCRAGRGREKEEGGLRGGGRVEGRRRGFVWRMKKGVKAIEEEVERKKEGRRGKEGRWRGGSEEGW